jgi:phosphatidylserine/phosphatidylglycerophosphate/cardiolipin synthase-like enzyme
VRALALDARENIRMLDRALKQAIDQAQSRCYVSAAYFVVPPWLRKTLARASDRGVDVRVVTAGQSDVTTARLAKRHAYGELLKRGVQLFEMYSQALHSKYIVIDDCLCLVGSHNLDRWSDLHNLEVSVAVVNPDLAGRLVETFHAYADQSEPYTLDDWRSRPLHQRAQQWILYALMQL